MSISSALSIALSGLNVAGRSADVTSANIANALTEGYGVRQLETSALVNGGAGAGVRVVGVTRNVDPILIGQRRGADADLGLNGEIAGFLTRVEALAEDILENGQTTPIRVREGKGRYVLLEGMHRLEALRALGETTVDGFIAHARLH